MKKDNNKNNKIQKTKNSEWIWFGNIVKTHGLKGEMAVLSDSDEPENALKIDSEILINENNYKIKSVRKNKNLYLISLHDFDDVNKVQKFINKKLYTQKVELNNQEFYYQDVINFQAYDNENNLIGHISDYFFQNKYYSFQIILINNDKINIPILDEFIKEIDKNEKKIIFNVNKDYYEN